MALPHNPLLALAAQAAAEHWDAERDAQELAAAFTDGLQREELLAAIQAIADAGLPADVAVWIGRLTMVLMAVSNIGEDAGLLHLSLAHTWLQRAQTGELVGYEVALHHCQAARPLVSADDPNYRALLQIEAVAASRSAILTLGARLQRLLHAEDEGALALMVDEWPEALGQPVQQGLRGLAEEARQAGDEATVAQAEVAQTRLQALRTARPQDAALADFLTTDRWGEARALVQNTTILQDWHMGERLAALATQARARGEEQEAQRYEAHQRQLAGWLKARQHPLLQLADQVRQGDRSLWQAIGEACKPEIVTTVDDETLEALDDHVENLALRDRYLAYILARLNDAIAPQVAGLSVQARCAFRLSNMGRGMDGTDLVMVHAKRALGLYREVGDRLGQAHALRGLGEVHCMQNHYDQAQQSYDQALGLYEAGGNRGGLINTYRAIGQVWQQQGELPQAYQAYRSALRHFEDIRGLQQRAASRRTVWAQASPLCAAMVRVCLDLDRVDEAWYWVEWGKGRTLLDLLGSARPRLDSPEKQEAYEAWQFWEQRVFALEEQFNHPHHNGIGQTRAAGELLPSPEIHERQLAEARQQEASSWQRLAQMLEKGRELLQVTVPSAKDLALSLRDLTLLQSEVAHHARRPLLVEYFLPVGDQCWVFLLPLWQVTAGQPLPMQVVQMPLPEDTMKQTVGAFATGLTAARQGFVGRYRGETPPGADALTEEERAERRQSALDTFAALSVAIGQAFVQPWVEVLKQKQLEPTELILVPNKLLHLLPLHAALLDDDTPLIDRYPLVYLSNAALAQTLVKRREAEHRPTGRLVMGPPEVLTKKSSLDVDLEGALIETQDLAADWGLQEVGQPYARERMRVHVLQEQARRLERAHLATHSSFDFTDYLRSHIRFSGEWLTLAHLISDETLDFHGMRLFYLSSCESGLTVPDRTDELQGLVWSVIYAGAEAVMASLWPVDDIAALYMASKFYDHWQPGTSLMQAYQAALRELWDEPDMQNPYYWAPFVLFGNGF